MVVEVASAAMFAVLVVILPWFRVRKNVPPSVDLPAVVVETTAVEAPPVSDVVVTSAFMSPVLNGMVSKVIEISLPPDVQTSAPALVTVTELTVVRDSSAVFTSAAAPSIVIAAVVCAAGTKAWVPEPRLVMSTIAVLEVALAALPECREKVSVEMLRT
jgi:hypothetical protein